MSGRTRATATTKAHLADQPQAAPRPVNIRKRLPRGDPDKGVAELKAMADRRAAELAPVVIELQAKGHTSVRKLAEALNACGESTGRAGSRWHVTSVQRLLVRIAALP